MDYSKPINQGSGDPPPSAPDLGYLPVPTGDATPTDAPTAPILDEKQTFADQSNVAQCRACHKPQADWDFIRPCLCPQVVHRSCLDKWRAVSPNPGSMTHCDTCNYAYDFEEDPLLERELCTPMCKFGLGVTRDVLIILAMCAGLVLLFGWVIVPAVDTSIPPWRNQWFPHSWNQRAIDSVSGLVIFFATMGVVGLSVVIIRALAEACSCCCQCCYQDSDRAHCRHHTISSYPYYGNDIFFFYIWYPFPTYPHGAVHGHGNHCCGAMGCGGCTSCDCNSGNNNGDGGVLILIVILILALIGLIFSIILVAGLIAKYMATYSKIVARYHEARRTRVRDRGVPSFDLV